MHYFGTELNDSGHYFWELDNDIISESSIQFNDIPFNPEDMPKYEKGQTVYKGTVEYYQISGYSVIAIEGSCRDHRPGSKSVFFLHENLSKTEMIDKIKSIPVAVRILNQMPFEVKW